MLRRLLAAFCGVVTGVAVIFAFEFLNSRLFPFPPGMDTSNLEQVRSFAGSMPGTALVLLLAAWILGSLTAGFVAALLSPAGTRRPAVTAGLGLTIGAAINAWIVRNPAWFHFGSLVLFLPLALAGARLARSFKARTSE